MSSLTPFGVIASAIVIAVFIVFARQRRRERRIVIDAFSKFIYRKTIDAILDSTASEQNEDGLWNREHEPELVSRYGSQWIAVVGKEVLATAATGDDAWNAAIARQPSRKPFVRRLSTQEGSGANPPLDPTPRLHAK